CSTGGMAAAGVDHW
nr:immunoglobulin heavy chain junction region [Macaca mulatta]MOV49323.1 immunoglobulin heavy chain junction region [Macaca mulatta]MOV49395.1 immunoglobulin heavy chain junction region [Macaca mulatta]MOV49444.1 immunoglobulin heavy chain junction region [Macaca mulatta]MOV49527.1 immunoglobulin heavy chain junction region [Macaca mulatta]